MAMKKIERKSFGDEKRVKLANKGDVLEGYYQGSETFDHKGKPLTKHRFKDEAGKIQSVLGDKQLNDDLPTIPVGSFTRITFDGKIRQNNGNSLNMYSIEYEETGL